LDLAGDDCPFGLTVDPLIGDADARIGDDSL